jgi:hypothetical protein
MGAPDVDTSFTYVCAAAVLAGNRSQSLSQVEQPALGSWLQRLVWQQHAADICGPTVCFLRGLSGTDTDERMRLMIWQSMHRCIAASQACAAWHSGEQLEHAARVSKCTIASAALCFAKR